MSLLMLEGQHADSANLDDLWRRFKDLSAYSLGHADILVSREGIEMLALGKFFGLSSNGHYHKNQERCARVSNEALAYQGDAEVVAKQVRARA
jgi:hypothetical protein